MNPNSQSQGGGFAGDPGQGRPQPAPSPQPVPAQQPLAPQAQAQTAPQQQAAAVNVLRTQIDSLYGDSPVATPHAAQPQAAPQAQATPQPHAAPQQPAAQVTQPEIHSSSPYNRTHSETTAQHTNIDPKQWKEYHSAWQGYYQKYYEAYYEHQKKQVTPVAPQGAVGSGAPAGATVAPVIAQDEPQDISKSEALQELRNRLLGKVKSRAETVRKSRHFFPIAAALGVMLIFVFLQYNRVLIGTVNAYVSPGSIDPQNIIVNPNGGGTISEEPRLIIPKINVDVPVMYDVGADHNSQMDAMEKGVAHFSIPGASSHPGEKGNTVLSGHSSNDLFDRGDYKFIFAQLDKLTDGDTIYANYEGKRYTYVVTKKEVVKPSEVSKLVYPTDKPVMTLITCTPLGTSLNRLLVTAEQISPNPTEASAAPTDSSVSGEDSAMPGNSATLLERMFGGR